MRRRQGANVARLQFKSRYSLQACEEKNTKGFCVKKNCRKTRLQATTLLQGRHASSFPLPNATHHAFIIYCRQRKHANWCDFCECVRCFKGGCQQNADTRAIYLERGKRNRNRVPFQIFCVPTRTIAKLRTYRDFGKRTPPFKFLNGSLGHTEDTRVRISYGHCD